MNNKVIVWIIVLLAVAGGIWWWNKRDVVQLPTEQQSPPTSTANVVPEKLEKQPTSTPSPTKKIITIPVTHIYAWGCRAPASYCVSERTDGCDGVYLELTGNTSILDKSRARCLECANEVEPSEACDSFMDKFCRTQWNLEGYYTGKSKKYSPANQGGGCSDAEYGKTFYITKVLTKD